MTVPYEFGLSSGLGWNVKAVVNTKYGIPSEVLRIQEMEMPVPKDNEALVRVRASSVNTINWYGVRGKPFLVRVAGMGFLRPKSTHPGGDVAGTVHAVGKNVEEFRPGDEVFGFGRGTFAEFATAPAETLVAKPATLSFEEAGTIPLAGLTALQALRTKGKVQSGHKVLVHGASGGVGTFAVQIAKALGAEVTAVCSTGKMELARSLGADRVIDYTREDIYRSGLRFDLVVAINGVRPIRYYRRALNANGACILVGGSVGQMLRFMMFGRRYARSPERRVLAFMMQPNKKDLEFLRDLIVAGKVKPVMDRNFPLTSVGDALQYLHEGHPRGKISVIV